MRRFVTRLAAVALPGVAIAGLSFALAYGLARPQPPAEKPSRWSALASDAATVATLERANAATQSWEQISGEAALWYDGEASSRFKFSVVDDGSFVVSSDWRLDARLGNGATLRLNHEFKEAQIVVGPGLAASQTATADERPTTVDLIDNAIAPGFVLEHVVAEKGQAVELAAASAERVSGRTTDRMHVDFGADDARAWPEGWDMWVDRKTGVVMRTEMSVGDDKGPTRNRTFEIKKVRYARDPALEAVVIPAGYTLTVVVVGADGVPSEQPSQVTTTDQRFTDVVAAQGG